MDPTSRAALWGRLGIVLAAVLWSTSGAFTKVLTRDTPLGLNDPPMDPLQIAFLRGVFATLALGPTLRRGDIAFRPLMIPMLVIFALMNVSFIAAQALGTAANAILLQYTAPLWILLAGVFWLGESATARGITSVVLGLLGVGVIVAGGWNASELGVIGLGLTSGITYGMVIVFLRQMRDVSPRWLTVLNQSGCALALLPFVWHMPVPTPGQLFAMFLFGSLQMGVPYLLMANGLRSVSAQEAGTISLLEPLLNPVWAYLISGEAPSMFTFVGGGFILAALLARYLPMRAPRVVPTAEPEDSSGTVRE